MDRDKAIWILDLFDSVYSPNFKPEFFKRKPLHNLLKTPNANEYMDFVNSIKPYVSLLSEKEQNVVVKRWGIENYVPKNVKDIAEELSISQQRVRMLETTAMGKIGKKLTEFLLPTDRRKQ